MDLHSVAEGHTQSKKLVVLRKYDELGGNKQKSPGNVECLVSAYRIRFEQTKKFTGLTDKEERKKKKRKMMAEEFKHSRVDYILHLHEKGYVLVFIYVSSINI